MEEEREDVFLSHKKRMETQDAQRSFDALQKLQQQMAQHHLQLIQLHQSKVSTAIPTPAAAAAATAAATGNGANAAPNASATASAGADPFADPYIMPPNRPTPATSSRLPPSSRGSSKPGSPPSRQQTPGADHAANMFHDTFSDEEDESMYAQRSDEIAKQEKEMFALMDKLDDVGDRLRQMHFLPIHINGKES